MMNRTSKNKPKVVATNIESFEEIKASLDVLPDSIFDQVELVSSGFNKIDVTLKPSYGKKIDIPSTCYQISRFDGYVGFYCESLFVKLPLENDKLLPQIIFRELRAIDESNESI